MIIKSLKIDRALEYLIWLDRITREIKISRNPVGGSSSNKSDRWASESTNPIGEGGLHQGVTANLRIRSNHRFYSQFSQEKINPKSKGILGFGTYSGYAYSELDLQGKDLEVFRVEAANGCHINFMKTCGNLFFMCQ